MSIGFGSRVRSLVAGAAIVACLSFSVQSLSAQGLPDFETITLTESPPPFDPRDPFSGFTFTTLSAPSINSSGQTAFSRIDSDFETSSSGIFSNAL